MLVDVSGTRDGVAWPKRGGEIDLPADEAQAMASQGQAEIVAAPEKPERAVARKPETRTAKKKG